MTRLLPPRTLAFLAAICAVLTACSPTPVSEKVTPGGLALQGHVQGGQQPVTGSTLQLYAVGTAGDASASTPLLTKTVTTSDGSGNTGDSNANAGNGYNALPAGAFTISGDYTCPSSTAEVYLVATGGNPGLAAGTNNKAISLMAALGPCGQLSASSYVFVDEVTTVGSVAALYPYMTSYSTLGSGSSDASAFAMAFNAVNEYANTTTGFAPGPALPAGYYASTAAINTLADVLAACINSTGGTSGDGSYCGTLFLLTKPASGNAPTDTIGAMLQILENPTNNVASIFNLLAANAPFQPELTSAPSDWTLPILPVPPAPSFSIGGGTYSGTQTLTLSDSTSGAAIYYTTNGTTPTTSSNLYTGALTISASETVQAIAVEDGRVSSSVASATYTIVSSTTPIIASISAITAQQTQTITITGLGFGSLAAYSGTSTYIFMHDVTNADWSAGYSGVGDTVGFGVTSWTNTQIVLSGFTGSYGGGNLLRTGDQLTFEIWNAPTVNGPATCSGVVVGGGATNCGSTLQAAMPVFSPGAGTYTSAQSVTLTTSTPGASIYYTTDGSTPTTGSLLYAGAIAVSSSETVNAIAVASGYTNSGVATAAYAIDAYGIISTFAGTGVSGYSGDGGPATGAKLVSPYATALDSYGNIYTADYGGDRVRKITPAGVISTFAGNGLASSAGDGGLATSASLNGPNGIAIDSANNVYIAEEHGARVRKVNTAGTISTIAGNGTQGYSGDGGAATSAELMDPEGIAVDPSGNLYIGDAYNNRVRKVTGGIITTFAGTGSAGYNGDGIAATSALLYTPYGVTTDSNGNVYIADTNGNRIRKVNASGIISTIAGNGSGTYNGDGIAATSASLSAPIGIVLDNSGNLYIADQGNHRVRKVNPAGTISTIAGNGTNGYSGDGGLATNAEMKNVEGVALDAVGNVYVGDGGNSVLRKVTYQTGVPVAATPSISPAGGTYTSSQSVALTDSTSGASIYYTTNGTTPSTSSTLYTGAITVSVSETIEAIAVASGYTTSAVASAVYTINLAPAATPTFSPAPTTYALTQSVTISDSTTGASIYYTTNGTTPTTGSTLYTGPIAVSASETIEAIAVAPGYSSSAVGTGAYVINAALGTITTIAGNGTAGFSGDGGVATSAEINNSQGVALDNLGNVYISDDSNNRIRKVNAAGIISTVAGAGAAGYTGDGGAATSATLNNPTAVLVDPSGNLFIADRNNNVVRKVTAAGVISTYAGTGSGGYSGDGGNASVAQLNNPRALAMDASGNLYISDSYNNRIRKVTPAGLISTYAGNGTAGFSGDGSAATSAELNTQNGIAFDANGNLYIGDVNNARVRKVTAAGVISTYAGTGTQASTGDGGAATSAAVEYPEAVAVDTGGNLYIMQYGAYTVRKVTTGGVISTVAGGGTSLLDGVAATAAGLGADFGVAVDAAGSIYIPDGTNRVRKVTYSAATAAATPTFSPAGGTYTSIQEVVISSATPSATIYFTTDGSTPTTTSNQYYGPFPVSTSETLRAIAVANGYANSAIGSAVYVINLPAAGTVTFSPGGGTYTTAQYVTLTVTTPVQYQSYSAYYTTDGSTPTTNSAQYIGTPIVVAASETINVLLTSYAYANVSASANYVLNLTHGQIVTVAGNGTAGYNGDGSPATSYELNQTYGIAADANGSIFIADNNNNRIRYLSPGGTISTVAGNGTPGSSGSLGPATSAELFIPWSVSVDSYGDFYIADTGNDRILLVNGVSADYMQQISGTGSLTAADGILSDARGNLYIAESAQIIRYSDQGVISVIAGTGVKGYNGEGTATSAQISIPTGMALDSSGNLYFADQDNNRVRKVTPAGVISTIAGTGTAGYNGEGTATSAQLNYPFGIAVDAAGNVYIADQGNSRIRKVTVATGIISTVAGNGSVGFAGDGGQATSATLSSALGVAVDPAGNLFIADKNRIRRVTP